MLDISMFCKRRDKTVRAARWPTLSTMMENIFIIVATVWEPRPVAGYIDMIRSNQPTSSSDFKYTLFRKDNKIIDGGKS